jgi:pSer/pThr/pTyr-binding forkhead associated (FHA) protein
VEALKDLPLHQATPAELKARLEAERGGIPFLLFADGDGRQHILTLDDKRSSIVVGRSARVDVSLAWDADVSRVHAELERIGGVWTIADDGLSRNGTYVNGDRIRGRRRLVERDLLRLGATTIVYREPPAVLGPAATQVTSHGPADQSVAISSAQRRVLVALARPCLAEGAFATPATNRQIAEELFLSVDAVKTHLRALNAKFGIEDLPQNAKRARLVELALRRGEISIRDLDPPAR